MRAGEEGGGPPSVLWVKPGASEHSLGPRPIPRAASTAKPGLGFYVQFRNFTNVWRSASPLCVRQGCCCREGPVRGQGG